MPLASAELWMDEVVVERIVRQLPVGRRPTVTERRAAAQNLLARGLGVEQVARMAGLAKRTVQQVRAQMLRPGPKADTERHGREENQRR